MVSFPEVPESLFYFVLASPFLLAAYFLACRAFFKFFFKALSSRSDKATAKREA